MSGFLGDWIRSMASAAIICGVALTVTPSGSVKNVLRVVCGALMTIVLVWPLTGGGKLWSALDASSYSQRARAVAQGALEEGTNISRDIIKQELESYVLDKAQSLGMEDVEVQVELRWSSEGCWYPVKVRLSAPTALGRQALERVIEGELGVPPEEQEWSIGE